MMQDDQTPLPDRQYHFYEPQAGHRLRHNPLNAIIAPRPIGWISTCDAHGRLNLAPYSFFNAFHYDPPIIGFAATAWKDTVENASQTGEFVWNLVTEELGPKMNITSTEVERGVDEFALAGLTPAKSLLVVPPRVAESRVAMECKVSDIHRLRSAAGDQLGGWMVFGEVVGVHIDEALLEDGVYQTARARPLLRGGGLGDYAVLTEDVMRNMPRPAGKRASDSHGA